MNSRCSQEIMEFVICQAMTFLSQVKSNCQNTIHKFHGTTRWNRMSAKFFRITNIYQSCSVTETFTMQFKESSTLLNILHYIQLGQSVSNSWDDEIDTCGKYLNKMAQKMHGICH